MVKLLIGWVQYVNRVRTHAYIDLAIAIVNSGIKTNDSAFLNSDWCKYLIDNIQGCVNHAGITFSTRYISHINI